MVKKNLNYNKISQVDVLRKTQYSSFKVLTAIICIA